MMNKIKIAISLFFVFQLAMYNSYGYDIKSKGLKQNIENIGYSGSNCIVETPAPRGSFKHLVDKGETLSSILKKYKVSLEQFLKSNKKFINSNLTLSLGEELLFKKRDLNSASNYEIDHQIKLHIDNFKKGSSNKNSDNGNIIDEKKNKKVNSNIDNSKKNITYTDINNSAVTKNKDKDIHNFSRDEQDNKEELKTFDGAINVALLLPITSKDGLPNKDFESFYKGVLLAMDSLKHTGSQINVNLFDTGKETDIVNDLVTTNALKKSNIIIGPVYNNQFEIVADYARRNNTAIVSPLAMVDASSPYVFQVAPTTDTRYDKLKDIVKDKNVVYFVSSNEDYSFVSKIKSFSNKNILPEFVATEEDEYINSNEMVYHVDMKEEEIARYLRKDVENVIVISSKKKNEIEMLLSKIVSVKNRFGAKYKISVVGSGEFNKMDDNKRGDFFKVNTYFVTSYHQDRLNEKSLDFENRYVRMFNELPTLFSYRGYDVAFMFINMMNEYGNKFIIYSEDNLTEILQVKYRFLKDENTGKNINQEWMLVNYKPNHTITTL